jgi:hypothetical protein
VGRKGCVPGPLIGRRVRRVRAASPNHEPCRRGHGWRVECHLGRDAQGRAPRDQEDSEPSGPRPGLISTCPFLSAWTRRRGLHSVSSLPEAGRAWPPEAQAGDVRLLQLKGDCRAQRSHVCPPQVQIRLKVKRRETVDVICGAVIGTRSAPQKIIAGLMIDGELRIVGRTTLLSPSARRALTPWLAPSAGKHPWPVQVSRTALGRFASTRSGVVYLTLVEPIVVEVRADVGWDGQRFRHLLRSLPAPTQRTAAPGRRTSPNLQPRSGCRCGLRESVSPWLCRSARR